MLSIVAFVWTLKVAICTTNHNATARVSRVIRELKKIKIGYTTPGSSSMVARANMQSSFGNFRVQVL